MACDAGDAPLHTHHGLYTPVCMHLPLCVCQQFWGRAVLKKIPLRGAPSCVLWQSRVGGLQAPSISESNRVVLHVGI